MPGFAAVVLAAAIAATAPGVRTERAPARGPGNTLCTKPKTLDATWHPMEAEGVTFRIPKGFTIGASGPDYQVYSAGQRHIGIEWGRGPGEIETGGSLDPISECRAVIDGRIVDITLFSWTRIDAPMAPSGDAGTKFLLVARFPSVTSSHAVSLWVFTPYRTDATRYRQLFWTVSFPGDAAGVAAAPSLVGGVAELAVGAPPKGGAPAPLGPAPKEHGISSTLTNGNPGVNSASASALPLPDRPSEEEPDPLCKPSPKGAPAPGAVVDTALVQSLASGADSLPHGYGVVALTFDASGALAGVAVVDSDLPADAERQLATIVSSNIKPRPATSTTLYLRVDTGGKALRYTMVRCGN